jgi:6-phosphogluconate dehydrogenase (decarboxylating)
MTNLGPKQRYEVEMINLLFIGRILVLKKANHNFAAAGYKKDKSLPHEIAECNFRSAANIFDCFRLLRKPSSMVMFLPIRSQVDSVIKDLSEQFKLDDFNLAEVQHCLLRFHNKNTSQKSRRKFLVEKK